MSARAYAMRIALAISLAAIAAVFSLSLRDARRYPGTDLRCRIVGARLLLAHRNPYPDPGAFEPDPYYRMFNDNTGSPALLLLYAPLRSLNYSAQRITYFALDWLCLALLFLLTRSWVPPPRRSAHLLAFTLLVVADYGLRLHLAEGQYYVILAVLIAATIQAWRDGQPRWRGAAALAAVLLLRPSFLIVLPALWLLGLRKHLGRASVATALLLVPILAAFGTQPSREYFSTVRTLQQQRIQSIFDFSSGYSSGPSTAAASPPNPPQASPDLARSAYSVVEQHDFSRKLASNYAVSRSSIGLCSIQQTLRPICARAFQSPRRFTLANTFALATVALGGLLLAWRLRSTAPAIRLGFAFLLPILLESFGPPRYAYSDVTLAPILLLLVAELLSSPLRSPLAIRIASIAFAVCALAAAAPYVLAPGGKAIMVLSLFRWIVLLATSAAFFARAGIRSEPAAQPPTFH